ncbi:START domain-containing protein [Hahella sp. SMD15-11]|uniref:START domain-containing protein n=1 Tax=Thermohahella caldifontis TaxID=3142973 RepID=A0AB39V0T6_9GAMM
MQLFFRISFLILFWANSALAADIPLEAEDWTLATEQDGIILYTRPQPDSSYKAFKAVTVLDAPLNDVLAVMADPQSCLAWVKGCIHVEGFDERSFNDRYAYSVNDMPWPVKDRDYVIHIVTTAREIPGTVVMHMTAAPEKRPVSADLVRVTVTQTHYYFTPTEDGRTRMVWLQHAEPGGVLPAWLVNALIVDIPVESIRALQKVVKQPRYQGYHLIYRDGELVGVSR